MVRLCCPPEFRPGQVPEFTVPEDMGNGTALPATRAGTSRGVHLDGAAANDP